MQGNVGFLATLYYEIQLSIGDEVEHSLAQLCRL
ncbi:hypothetical protein AN389_00269 [Pseudoalteromonas sp. P1-7a]|nr:hypothetical protein AN389_00269 [Pseudoalteromonas sp. P1-7a]